VASYSLHVPDVSAHGSPALRPAAGRRQEGRRRGASRRGGPLPAIDARTSGMQKAGRATFRCTGTSAPAHVFEIPRFDAEFLFSTGCRPASGRMTSASIAARRRADRVVIPPRRAARPADSSNQSIPLQQRETARASVGRDSFAKSVLWGFTVAAETERPCAGDAPIHAARRDERGSACVPELPRRSHAQRVLPPNTKAFRRTARIDMLLTSSTRPRADAAAVARPAQGRRRSGRRRPRGRRRRTGGGLFSGTVASVTPTADAVTMREHIHSSSCPTPLQAALRHPRAGYAA